MGRPSKCPPEFRRGAVELVKTSERPRVGIARSLGISDNTLANWIAADREAQARSDELRHLRKENIELLLRTRGGVYSPYGAAAPAT